MATKLLQNCDSITQFADLKFIFDKLLFHINSDRKINVLHSKSIFSPDMSLNYPHLCYRHIIKNYVLPSSLPDAANTASENAKQTDEHHSAEYQHEISIKSDDLESNYNEEKILNMLKVLTSADAEVNIKWKILDVLIGTCSSNKMPVNVIITNDLLHYTQMLLVTYSNMISDKKKKDFTTKQKAELKLIIPLLKLLTFSRTMTVENIRRAYIYRSYVMLELMQTLTHCFQTAADLGIRIRNYTNGKVVISAANQMEHKEAQATFGNCYGLRIRNPNFHIVGYKVILFDTLNASFSSRNINDRLQRVKMDILSSSKPQVVGNFNYKEAEWMPLIVAKLLPLKYLLVYTELKWKDHLLHLSAQIQRFLTESNQYESSQQKVIEAGDVIGFKSSEATFDGRPLLTVQCLRGYVLAVTRGRMMVWAMDIGLLCYTSDAYVKHLPQNCGFCEPALIKFCKIQGVECDFDENVFVHASELLLILLKNNSQTGKHMLLSEKGESILCLLEHPHFEIRIKVLDILLCLAENCQEICTFMEKKSFDICLAGKLERYAHAYASHMHKDRSLFNVETIVMTKILSAIFDGKKELKKWPANKQATRAFQILQDIQDFTQRKLITKCLQQLQPWYRENNISCSRPKETSNMKDTMHNSKLPRNNTLCEYSFHKFDATQEVQHETTITLDTQADGKQTVPLKSNTDYYVLGSKVDIVPDQTHEFMEHITLDDLKEVQLAEVLCGLLNNNTESIMYFGLSKDSIVTGIVLHRVDKDAFRNGIDRIMSKCLLPEVRADSYEVLFTPVLKSGDKPMDISKIHLYVIEVRVQPLMHMAYVIYQGRRCFMRQDTNTIEWTVMQKSNYMMEQEEIILDNSIKKLSDDSRKNKKLLAKLVQKYVEENS